MLTGKQHILQERHEQIHKHGWSLTHDQYYSSGQLVQAALFCLNPDCFLWPDTWDEEFRIKIIKKDKINRLRVAGAFFLAENDRLANDKYLDVIDKIAKSIDELQSV